MIRVKHLLERKGNTVETIDAGRPVLEALEVMAQHEIGALPVVRNGELVGMLSERDYARKVVLLGRTSAETEVARIMASPVVTVEPNDTVSHCMKLMTDRRFRHLPVLENGKLIGIVSIGDLVRAQIEEAQDTIRELERFISG
jgi:CBS domain-containing protein